MGRERGVFGGINKGYGKGVSEDWRRASIVHVPVDWSPVTFIQVIYIYIGHIINNYQTIDS